ncbi:hypothetical protein BC830DRAFT_260870 [Chytriomyces sp. MP71]|nr:hypothetical protein BC830DRAFT_260870 [Chytriomyces sp. MP71]
MLGVGSSPTRRCQRTPPPRRNSMAPPLLCPTSQELLSTRSRLRATPKQVGRAHNLVGIAGETPSSGSLHSKLMHEIMTSAAKRAPVRVEVLEQLETRSPSGDRVPSETETASVSDAPNTPVSAATSIPRLLPPPPEFSRKRKLSSASSSSHWIRSRSPSPPQKFRKRAKLARAKPVKQAVWSQTANAAGVAVVAIAPMVAFVLGYAIGSA